VSFISQHTILAPHLVSSMKSLFFRVRVD